MTKVNSYQFLGLPRNASPDEVERRYSALLDWLQSERIPQNLRPWAEAQQDLIQEVYETLESAGEDTEKRSEVAIAATVRSKRSFLQSLARPWVLAPAGVVVGLAILGGLWWTGVIPGKEKTPAASTSDQQESFDPQTFLAAHESQLAAWEKAVADNPKDVEALFNLGETNIVGEQWEKSIYWFKKLLEADPEGEYAQHARLDIGVAYMNMNKVDEAQASISEVLILDPNSAQAHYDMGFLLAYVRTPVDLPGAIAHLNEVIRLAPNTDLATAASQHLAQLQTGATP